jgi:putative inorganic carbon (HCO3(-)) transporter
MRLFRRPEAWWALLIGGVAGALAGFSPLAAVGLLFGGIIVGLVLFGPDVLLLGAVAVEPWTDALNFPSATVSIPKILGFLAFAGWMFAVISGRRDLRFTPQMGWAFAFLFVTLLSLMFAVVPGAGSTEAISYVLYVMFLVIFVQSIRTQAEIDRCLGIYTFAIAVGTFYGLATFTAGVAHLASGPIADPNDYASTLAGGLPLAAFFARYAKRGRWLWRIGALLIVATLLATLSRGAAVGFGVVLLWAFFSGRISFRVIASIVVAVAVGGGIGYLLFKPVINAHLQEKSAIATTNVVSREAFWTAAIHMAERHPILGVGPNGFTMLAQSYVQNDPIVLQNPETHNTYLQILAEGGIVGLALYLGFLLSTAQALRTAKRLAAAVGDRRGVDLADALMAGFLWTVVTMIFITRQLAIPLFLIGGIAGSINLARAAGSEDELQAGTTRRPTLAPAPPRPAIAPPSAG